jgi:hypothetical protein
MRRTSSFFDEEEEGKENTKKREIKRLHSSSPKHRARAFSLFLYRSLSLSLTKKW